MKISRIVFSFLLAILFIAITSAVIPQTAQAKTCHDVTGRVVPCPQPRNTPTSIPGTSIPSPTECRLPDGAPCTPASTSTTAAFPPNASGAGDAGNSNGDLPAVQNPDPGPSLSGPLSWILALFLIAVCLGGGFLFFFRKAGGTDSIAPQPPTNGGSIGDPGLLDGNDKGKTGAFEVKDWSFEVENKSTIGSATSGAGSGRRALGEINLEPKPKPPPDKA